MLAGGGRGCYVVGALNPACSIIVPTRNRPQAVEACLEALAALQQPPGGFEVIVVDDGSEKPLVVGPVSHTRELQLRVISQQNTGPAGARNRGAREARGEILAFTDDDCRPAHGWLVTLQAALQRQPEALVGGTTVNALRHNTGAAASQLIVDLVYAHFNADAENAYFFTSNNMACTREAFFAVGGFDESFPFPAAEDREFCDRWRMCGQPLVWVREAVIEHRHAQKLLKFLAVHYRYGSGAYRYQRIRRVRRSGTMQADLAFHRSLPRLLPAHLSAVGTSKLLPVLCYLALWQAANAAGFFSESLHRSAHASGALP